jgi:hypothetical protein
MRSRRGHELIESVMSDAFQLVQIGLNSPPRVPKPDWLRAKARVGENFHNLKKLARGLGLHTVCESAQCNFTPFTLTAVVVPWLGRVMALSTVASKVILSV